jgi:SAM-dependent methyltransferase
MAPPPRLSECIVCAATTPHDEVYVKRGYPIVRCAACGLGSTVVPAGFDPDSIYDDEYFDGGHADGYGDYVGSERTLRAEFRRALARVRREVPSGRLLEIGCAFGFFLDEARKHFECVGIDVSEAAVRHCKSVGLDAHRRSVGVPLDDLGRFDAVVMLDCIEHFSHPAAAIGDAARVLAPGGVVMLTTGDWNSALARVMGRRWRLMTPPQHLYFFSRRTLSSLLTAHGLEVASCTRPWKLVPMGLVAYQVGNRLGLRLRALERVNAVGVPVNLLDTICILARKRPPA